MLNIVSRRIASFFVFFSIFAFSFFSVPTPVKAESTLSKIYTTYIIEPGVFAIETLSEMFSILTGGNVNLLANTSSSTASSNIFTDYIIDPLGNVFYNIFDFSVPVVEPTINTVPKVTTTTLPPTPEPVFEQPVIETTPITNQYFNTYTTPATSVSIGERGPQGPQGPRGPQGPAGSDATFDTSNFVSSVFFDNQVNGILTSIEDGISGLSSSLGEQVQTALLSVSGGTDLSGAVVIGSTLSGTDKALIVNNNTSTGNIFEAQDGGSPVFTIADGGNVGIGVASPLAKLHVAGSLRLDDTSGATSPDIDLLSNTGQYVARLINSGGSTGFLQLYSSAGIVTTQLAGGGASPGYINAGTNFGIGTTGPGKALEINSATGANLRLTYNDADGSAANYSDFTIGSTGGLTLTAAGTNPKTLVVNNGTSTGNIFEAQDNGTAVFTVADGGNVSSSGTVSVGGTTPNSDIYFYLDKTGTLPTGSIGNNIVMNRTDTGGGTNTAYRADIKLAAATTATTMLGMNLNIGTSISGATLTTGQGLQSNILNVPGATLSNATGGYFGLVNVGTATTWKGTDVSIVNAGTIGTTYGMYVGDITSGTQTNTPFSFYASDVNALNYFGGSVGIGDDTPDALLDVKGTVCLDINADDVCTDDTSALSDSRLKDNVTDIQNGLELVREFRPVNFTWNGINNTGNSNSLGFIAQDMEAIFPNLDLIITDTAGYKHLDYSKLTAVLTDAIQELDINLNAISGNITPESESFATAFFENVFSKVTTWLADAGNGIGDLFADSVYTKELCVTKSNGENFCVTGDQLESLVGSGGGSSGSGSTGGDEPVLEEPLVPSDPVEGEPETVPTEGEPTTEEEQTTPAPEEGEEVVVEEDPVQTETDPAPEEAESVPESTPETI